MLSKGFVFLAVCLMLSSYAKAEDSHVAEDKETRTAHRVAAPSDLKDFLLGLSDQDHMQPFSYTPLSRPTLNPDQAYAIADDLIKANVDLAKFKEACMFFRNLTDSGRFTALLSTYYGEEYVKMAVRFAKTKYDLNEFKKIHSAVFSFRKPVLFGAADVKPLQMQMFPGRASVELAFALMSQQPFKVTAEDLKKKLHEKSLSAVDLRDLNEFQMGFLRTLGLKDDQISAVQTVNDRWVFYN